MPRGGRTAQNNLGAMYELGKGVPREPYQAVEWYSRAAVQGDVSSQVNLGRMYRNGLGVPQDKQKAIKWFEKAAAQGDDEARKFMKQMRLYR